MIHGNRECERWALFMAAAMSRSLDSPEHYADHACEEYDKRFTFNGDKRCQNIARNDKQCEGALYHFKADDKEVHMCAAGKEWVEDPVITAAKLLR